MASLIQFEVTKKIDFKQKEEDFLDSVMNILNTRTQQMTDVVKSNIRGHDNIDTSTLISDLETKVTVSDGKGVVTGETASNVTGNPKGHRGYAPMLEYGTARTSAYPNFIPALDTIEPMVMRDLNRIRL